MGKAEFSSGETNTSMEPSRESAMWLMLISSGTATANCMRVAGGWRRATNHVTAETATSAYGRDKPREEGTRRERMRPPPRLRAPRRSSRFQRMRSEQRKDLAPTGNAAPDSFPGSGARCDRAWARLHVEGRTIPAGRLSRPPSLSPPQCRGGRRARRRAFRRARRRTRRCRCE